jgi:hypothetical protein
MGNAGPFYFKLKHFMVKMTIYNKIKGLKWTDDKWMFQYEKPSQMKEGCSVFIKQAVFFHFPP